MKTKITLLITVLAFFFQQGLIGADLKKGLVAHYPFNGDAKDASGNDLDGKPTNCKFVPVGSDAKNKAASFSGNGWVELPRDKKLNFGAGDFTYSAWIKTPHKQKGQIVSQDWDSRMARAINLKDGGKERPTISVSFSVSDDEEDSGNVTTGNNVTDNK